jgi:hypothetical protein
LKVYSLRVLPIEPAEVFAWGGALIFATRENGNANTQEQKKLVSAVLHK